MNDLRVYNNTDYNITSLTLQIVGPAEEPEPFGEQLSPTSPRTRTPRYPGLGHQVEEGMAVAIDGEIFQDAYLVPLKPDSEIYLIPKIGGG